MKITQSNLFAKGVKKLNKPEKLTLDEEIRKIASGKTSGEQKKGDLSGVFVYKFKVKSALRLLAYRLTDEELQLIMVGAHENYYRDLKNFLNT